MHFAALVSQVGTDHPEMDALGRRALAQAVELAAAVGDGLCTAFAVGPASAEDVLREAIAWGRTCSVFTDGVLLSDPEFADDDTLATARLLAAAIGHEGRYDLVLVGADRGEGQLGPQLAELLDRPFAASARYISMQGNVLHVRCERDDGWMQVSLPMPALVSCAAGLIEPCEVTTTVRATVPPERIHTLTAHDVAAPPLDDRPRGSIDRGGTVAIVLPPASLDAAAREPEVGGDIVALAVDGSTVEEDIARAITAWAMDELPRALLLPDTAWGREIAGRLTVRLAGSSIEVKVTGAAETRRRGAAAGRVRRILAEPRSRVRVVSRSVRDRTR